MAGDGNSLLPFFAPDFYAKQLPIQRQQALAQMLMQQGGGDPGNARYGGLRNAANMIAGALLGRRADSALGQLYTGPESPVAGTDTGQVSNAPQQTPELQGNQQPYEGTDSTNLFPGLHNTGQSSPQQPAALPSKTATDETIFGFKTIPSLGQRVSAAMVWKGIETGDFGDYVNALEKELGPTEIEKTYRAYAQAPDGSPQKEIYKQAIDKLTVPDPIREAQFAAVDPAQAQQYAATKFKTPEQNNAEAGYPGDPAAQTQAIRAQVERAGTITARGGSYLIGPDGKKMSLPDQNGDVTVFDEQGVPAARMPLMNAINLAAQRTGATTAAASANTINPVVNSKGATIPVWAGSGIPAAGNPAPANQLFGPKPGGAYPPITGNPNAPNPNGRVDIGQTTADKELQQRTGVEAAADAKFQAAADPALAALDRLEAINNDTPDSTFLDPTAKAEWMKRSGATNYTTNTELWHTINENTLAGAIEQIRSSGGSRIPQGLVDELKKARGIDIDQPVATRAANIREMRRIIMDAKAASHNTVANMNAPDATTTTTREPVGGAPALAPQQFHEGQTATGPGGKKIIFRAGKWVPN